MRRREKIENLEQSPAVCGCRPEPRTDPVWCESQRSDCTPGAEPSPAWLTEWTAACPSLSPHSGIFPKPESKEHIRKWEHVQNIPERPTWGSQCFGFLSFCFCFTFNSPCCVVCLGLFTERTNAPQRKQLPHNDNELASHSRNTKAGRYSRDTQRDDSFCVNNDFATVCHTLKGVTYTLSLKQCNVLWKTGLLLEHASWRVRH